jgi:hypothetical protein
MSEQSNRWSEVGEKLEALALKLKLHFEQSDRRDETADTMEKLRNSVSDAFDATGNAVRDDAVKADVREAGRLFVDAMSATFAKVSDELKERAEGMRDRNKPEHTPEPPKPIDPA